MQEWDEGATQSEVLKSIICSVRILGVHVLKDVCLPREASCVPVEKSRATEFRLRSGQPVPTAQEESADGIVAGGNEMREHLRVKRNRSLTPGEGLNGARTEWYG